jgi:hypothetical protein
LDKQLRRILKPDGPVIYLHLEGPTIFGLNWTEHSQNDGVENFTFSILDVCLSQSALDDREIFWIKKYSTISDGYHLEIGGRGGKVDKSKYEGMFSPQQKIENTHWTIVDGTIHPPSAKIDVMWICGETRRVEVYALTHGKQLVVDVAAAISPMAQPLYRKQPIRSGRLGPRNVFLMMTWRKL